VQQILAFSRQQGHAQRPIQLRHITEEAMRLLRAAVPTTVEFQIMLGNDVPVVLADETQVHQILMNLGTNAAHAMREHGGQLTVKLENCTIDAELGTGQSKLSAGQYARLTVIDTGHGMDERTLGKIFEPFFTTKPPGDGVGLGLAVVRGIVNEHKGMITVSSRCGQGTTFQVYFPAHRVVVDEVVNTSPIVQRGSGERILFVDDEPTLANLGKLVLDRYGYATDTCSDGRQALELVQASPDAYALVITDQMMPFMTGTDLAQRLGTIRPNLPIIIATGCLDPLLPDQLRALGIRQLLRKPLSVRALALAAHQVLSSEAIASQP
jgi:CheY-like chemotaxis protein